MQLGFSLLLSMGAGAALAADQPAGDATPAVSNQSQSQTTVSNENSQTTFESHETVQYKSEGTTAPAESAAPSENQPVAPPEPSVLAPTTQVASAPVEASAVATAAPSTTQPSTAEKPWTALGWVSFASTSNQSETPIDLVSPPTPVVPHDPTTPKGAMGWLHGMSVLLASISIPAMGYSFVGAIVAGNSLIGLTLPTALIGLFFLAISMFITRMRISGYSHGARSDNLVAIPLFATPLEMGSAGRKAGLW